MEALTAALAKAIVAGTDLAWPALVLYFTTNVLGNLTIGGTLIGIVWTITQCVLRFPEADALARMKREQAELDAYKVREAIRSAGFDAEFAHKHRMRALDPPRAPLFVAAQENK